MYFICYSNIHDVALLVGFRIPAGEEIFSFLKRLLGPPSHLYIGYGVKLPGREVNHWSKNEWSYTSAPPIYRHGMDRDSFTIK